MSTRYPVTFSVDYPDRPLNRLTTFFRLIVAIPILIVFSGIGGVSIVHSGISHTATQVVGVGGLLYIGPFLMILFRQKYPRWWFDWNLELTRFNNRVGTYLLLMNDHYPSTEEEQWVHFDIPYPNVKQDLSRWMPLVKWFLAIPHYIILFFLDIALLFVTVVAWFAILITGHYPKSIFEFTEGILRWNLRVASYAFLLVTDEYPPFSLEN